MNAEEKLTAEERSYLLRLARQSIERAVTHHPPPEIDLASLSPRLVADGASFVTLTEAGELRGCIGALEPYQPLALDVREHAAAAATEDYRFPPVRQAELPQLHIEISRLTVPQPLAFDGPEDLLSKLRPGVDGVVLRHGFQRATFLPQVWEKLPDPEDFLANLCYKMGAPANLWRTRPVTVLVYQVEEFEEEK